MTCANGRREHCGSVSVLATTRLYPNSHGIVLRCASCGGVLLRVVDHAWRVYLDLRGLSYLKFEAG